MLKKTIYIGIAVVIIALIACSYLFFGLSKEIVPSATIFMTKDGFSPVEVTVKKGQAIEFVNGAPKECPLSDASCNFWPASDLHPTHELYAEFDSRKPIGPGESWVFVFEKTGNWSMHDHFKARNRGIIHVVD